jgi:pyruvate dehydrogenase E2 component (dihydrolipoamide acetyltransferase)
LAKAVIMPKFGFTQEEGTIVRWLVKEGDTVEQGDPLAEVTTDKINMEVEAPVGGIVGGIRYPEGAVVPVTKVICYLLAPGESVPAEDEPAAAEAPSTAPPASAETAAPGAAGAVSATPVARRIAEAEGIDLTGLTGSGPGGKITRQDVERQLTAVKGDGKVRATPAARRLAQEAGLDLSTVQGSGPRGRVQGSDVQAALAARPAAPPPVPAAVVAVPQPVFVSGEPVIVPLEGMRRTIAQRLQASYQQAVHITFTLDVDMTKAIAFRELANQRLPEGHPGVSMTALIVKAVAWALRRHPLLNSYLQNDQIIMIPTVNVGVAVALPDGLIVPVVKNADQKGLLQIGAEVADLSQRARAGTLKPEDVADGTFTVSNLGMFGVDHFTAIINPPQVGILAVGRTARRFVPGEDDQPVVRPIMTITLSVDHRVVDGAQAAQFATDLRGALEEPASIVL